MLCCRSESFKLLHTAKQTPSGLPMASQCSQTTCKLSKAAMLLVNQSCTLDTSPLKQTAVLCELQGKLRAADPLHAKPVHHAPTQAAVPSSNIVWTSTMVQATKAAHTTHMAQISAQTQAKSRVQTSACSAQYCSVSGTMPRMLTMATSSSSLTVAGKCGGDVLSAQMAILMSGKLVFQTGPMTALAPSVAITECVSTVHWPQSILTLLRSSVTETRAQLTTAQLPATRRCFGDAKMDMSMLLQSAVGQPKPVAVLNALQFANHHSLSSGILS